MMDTATHKSRIGIYGGTFDPFHMGHLHALRAFDAAIHPDAIWLVPTYLPPHKTHRPTDDPAQRLAMLRALCASDTLSGLPCRVEPYEIEKAGKSYTYDTVEQLKKHYPDDDFYLIVGSDQYLYFQNWYRADDILKSVTLCTAAREKGDEYEKMLSYKKSFSNMKNSIISLFPVVEASSSQIRLRIKQGKSIDELVPSAVAQYIGENRLYE